MLTCPTCGSERVYVPSEPAPEGTMECADCGMIDWPDDMADENETLHPPQKTVD